MRSLIEEINQRIDAINPAEYGKRRNFINGPVTELSPYISRGFISTKYVLNSLKLKGFTSFQLERLEQQLLWRDYFQRVYQQHPNLANENVKNNPSHFVSNQLSEAIVNAQTGIYAIDEGIQRLKADGMMHNHMRMYVAMLATNIAKTHWKAGADWMYYHLLDADVASNYLSWQWVCGAFSSKLYYANQENINKYSGINQSNTYLDCDYEDFPSLKVPEIFSNRISLAYLENKKFDLDLTSLEFDSQSNLKLFFPKNSGDHSSKFNLNDWLTQVKSLNSNEKLPVYTIYNLDVNWHNQPNNPKVLLIDTDLLSAYPMSKNTIDFILKLSAEFSNLVCFVGNWTDFSGYLDQVNRQVKCVFKEHPTNQHYQGVCENRDWIDPEITKYYPSFFGYWKAYEKSSRKK